MRLPDSKREQVLAAIEAALQLAGYSAAVSRLASRAALAACAQNNRRAGRAIEAIDYVKELVAAGLTQAEVAARAGLGQPTVSKILRGEVRDVMSRNYRRLQRLHQEVIAAPADKAVQGEDQREAA